MTTALLDSDPAALPETRTTGQRDRAAVSAPSLRAERAEERLSAFWQQHSESGERLRTTVVRRPRQVARAVADALTLPRLEALLTDSDGGRRLREQLQRTVIGRLTVGGSGACVLHIPDQPGAYQQGPRRQTLRRKTRAAQRRGVTTREVTAASEQRELAALLAEALRSKTDQRYRDEADQAFLAGKGLWTVAQSDDGSPLVIAVTPFDGD